MLTKDLVHDKHTLKKVCINTGDFTAYCFYRRFCHRAFIDYQMIFSLAIHISSSFHPLKYKGCPVM